MTSVIGIIVAVIVMVVLYYYDFQPFFAAVIATLILCLFNGLPIMETLCRTMITGGASTMAMVLSMSLPGAVLAQIYNESGAANAMARTVSGAIEKISGKTFRGQLHAALLTIELISAILLLGGMNGFVVMFATFPIVISLLKKLNLPRRYTIGLTMGLSCWCNIIPGSPQMYNALVVNFVNGAGGHTTAAGALVPGLITALFMAAASYFYFYFALTREHNKGCEYVPGRGDPEEKALENPPHFLLTLIPLIVVFATYNFLHWELGASTTVAFIVALLLFHKNLGKPKQMMATVGRGVEFVSVTLIIVVAVAGFGSVMSSTEGFQIITRTMLSLSGNMPLFALALAVLVLVGIQGNGNGGLMIAVPVLAPIFLAMGLNGEAIHRVASVAATTFDSLPTSSVVIGLLAMLGQKQRDTYGPVFVSTVLITILATILCTILCTVML